MTTLATTTTLARHPYGDETAPQSRRHVSAVGRQPPIRLRVLVVGAGSRTARWFIDDGDLTHDERDASALTGLAAAEIVAALRWPA